MSKQKKRNIIIGSLCAVVLLMAVGYAAFQSALNIEGTSNITSSWNIKITGITSKNIVGTASNNGEPTFEDLTATFKTNLVSPGDSIEYDITVKNAGTVNAKLDKVTLSDTSNPVIKFTSSGLTEGDVLSAGRTTTLTVKVEFLSSVTEFPESKTSTLTVSLDYSQSTGEASGGVIDVDILKENVVATGDGLYVDTYEKGRYVYKGTNPSNYITYNGEEWRIMAIEADNTLKIRKVDSIGQKSFDTTGLNGNCNWSASTLNTYLNNEYYNTLSLDAQNQIQSHSFAYGFITDYNTDLAKQISDEKSKLWTGNIGLMSASDYLNANNNIEQCGNFNLNGKNREICLTTNYLKPTAPNIVTINPFNDTAVLDPPMVTIRSNGSMSGTRPLSSFDIFPALYLKSDITLSGEGTQLNPYTIG